MAVDIVPAGISCENNNNNDRKIPPTSYQDEGKEERKPKQSGISDNVTAEGTQYEKLCHELLDERTVKDFSLGKRIGFYRMRKDIGSGNFAKVKLGFHCLVKEKVAIKILDKTKLDEKTLRLLSQEIASMEKMVHPVIVRIFEVLETLSQVYIVTEYATSGELFHKVISDGKLPESDAKMYYSQILSGVCHMHQNNIIHRDIKAENVFLSGMQCKIGDFGFSTIISEQDQHLNTFCGSPPYAAPELFKDDYYIGRYVDIWALGILLYFMTTGFMPFRADTVGKLKRKILEGTFSVPDHISLSLRYLLINIIRLLAEDRFTMAEIMRSEWLEGETFPEPRTVHSGRPPLDLNQDVVLSTVEERALKQLRGFGISDEIMLGCAAHSRDSITGTYRVALYQAERREEEEKEKLRVGLEQQRNRDKMGENSKPEILGRSSTRSRFCMLI